MGMAFAQAQACMTALPARTGRVVMPKPLRVSGAAARSAVTPLRPRVGAVRRVHARRAGVVVRAAADDELGTPELAGAAAGLVANPVVYWSLFTLKTTGCGLPPGPGGSLGALEGISYLVILGIVGWSASYKAKTGTGLPAGPAGLLGAAEGLSYLSLLAMIIVGVLQFTNYGYIPGPLPSAECFG